MLLEPLCDTRYAHSDSDRCHELNFVGAGRELLERDQWKQGLLHDDGQMV